MTSDQTIATPRRRWFQFSLWTLLVLMLLFGGPFASMSPKVKRAVEQRLVVRAIEAIGGTASCAFSDSLMTPHLKGSDGPSNRQRLIALACVPEAYWIGDW